MISLKYYSSTETPAGYGTFDLSSYSEDSGIAKLDWACSTHCNGSCPSCRYDPDCNTLYDSSVAYQSDLTSHHNESTFEGFEDLLTPLELLIIWA